MMNRSVRVFAAFAFSLSLAAFASAQHEDHQDKHAEHQQDQGAQAGQMPKPGPNSPYFGAKFAPVTDEKAEELGLDSQDGVVIMEVLPDSPAEKAGLKKDDVVKKFDDKDIDGVQGFVAMMRTTKPDQQVKVSIIREKKPQDITVTIGHRPPSMDAIQQQLEKERKEREKGNPDNDDKDKSPATKPS